MEKYSVLMSLYHKEKAEYLRIAIESMVNQTIQPDEIVIVKDGKITEELQSVLDEFEEKYPEMFNIVGYEENRGLGQALNYGMNYCSNGLVARMDADDIAELNRCEMQLEMFQKNPQLDIVGGQIDEFIADKNNVVGKRIVPIEDIEIKEYMKTRCPFNHMTVMFRKKAVLEVGNYQHWHWNEDYFLWIRMYQNDCKFANINQKLVNVRVGEDMYNRRGGCSYFKSELDIQKYMLKNGIISIGIYITNIVKRFIVQVLLTNRLRSIVYKVFARE